MGIMGPEFGLRRISPCLLNCKLDKGFFSLDMTKHIPIGKLHNFHGNPENGLAAHQQLRYKILHLNSSLGHGGALNKTAL